MAYRFESVFVQSESLRGYQSSSLLGLIAE